MTIQTAPVETGPDYARDVATDAMRDLLLSLKASGDDPYEVADEVTRVLFDAVALLADGDAIMTTPVADAARAATDEDALAEALAPWLRETDAPPLRVEADDVEDDDEGPGEAPDTCRGPDGHWYVITYGAARWQIHADDCNHPDHLDRTHEVEVTFTVVGSEDDDAAYETVDKLLDLLVTPHVLKERGIHWEMVEGCVTDVTPTTND